MLQLSVRHGMVTSLLSICYPSNPPDVQPLCLNWPDSRVCLVLHYLLASATKLVCAFHCRLPQLVLSSNILYCAAVHAQLPVASMCNIGMLLLSSLPLCLQKLTGTSIASFSLFPAQASSIRAQLCCSHSPRTFSCSIHTYKNALPLQWQHILHDSIAVQRSSILSQPSVTI